MSSLILWPVLLFVHLAFHSGVGSLPLVMLRLQILLQSCHPTALKLYSWLLLHKFSASCLSLFNSILLLGHISKLSSPWDFFLFFFLLIFATSLKLPRLVLSAHLISTGFVSLSKLLMKMLRIAATRTHTILLEILAVNH